MLLDPKTYVKNEVQLDRISKNSIKNFVIFTIKYEQLYLRLAIFYENIFE